MTNDQFPINVKSIFKKGFSLLEVIIILALLSLGFFPLMVSLSQVTVGAGHAEKAYIAADLARDKIEAIKATPFDNISGEAATNIAGFTGYTSFVTVESSTNLKNVVIVISGESQTVILRTLISNYD